MASETLAFNIFARDNASGSFRDLGREVDRTDDKMGRLSRTFAGGIAPASALGTTIAGLGPALIPVAAGLTAAFAGLSVPLVAATAGVGSFALFAVPAFKAVTDASTKMAAAQDAVDNALTSSARQSALARQKQLMADLSPATVAAAKSLDGFKTTFAGFQTALAPQLFGVFNAGLSAATALLPSLATLAKSVAPALTGLATSLGSAFKSPEFKSFVSFLAAQAGPAVKAFGTIAGDLAKGFGGLLVAFAPVGKIVLSGLGNLAKAFSTMSQSAGFKAFLKYAVDNLPLMATFFGDVMRAVGALLSALAPLGPVVLKVLDAVVKGIGVLAKNAPAAAVAMAGIAVALLAVGGPVGLVAAGLIAVGLAFKHVYDHSAPLRAVLRRVADIVVELATKAFPVLQGIAHRVMQGVATAIHTVSAAIAKNRPQIDQLLHGWRTFATFMIARVFPVLGPILKGVLVAVGVSIATAITVIAGLVRAFNVARTVVSAVLATFRAVWHAITAVVSAAVGTVIATVGRVRAVVGIIGGAFTAARTAVAGAIGAVVSLAGSLPGRIMSAVGSLGSLLFNAGRSVIQGLINGISSALGPLRAIVSTAAGVIKSVAGHLGIHSPSTYMDWVGRQSMAGLIGGIGRQVPALAGQMRDVSSVVGGVGGTGIPQLGAGQAGGGSSSQPLVVQLVLDGRVVQQVLLKLKHSNGGGVLGLA